MEDPCIVQDTVVRDSECGNPIVVKPWRAHEPYYVMPDFKKMWREIDNEMLIAELKRITKSTEPKRHYHLRYRKGRK